MAKIKLGGLAQDVRGTLNGTVFGRNKGGAYARTKSSPTQPRTTAQSTVRSIFAGIAKAWQALTDDTARAQFTAWALTHPITDVFGNSIVLSGIAAFQRLNRIVVSLGGTMLTAPPVDFSVTALSSATVTFKNGGTPDLKVATLPASLATNEQLYVMMTPPVNTGVTNVNKQLRMVNDGVTAIAPATDFSDLYLARFPLGTPATGTKIGYVIGVANKVTGAVSPGISGTLFVEVPGA